MGQAHYESALFCIGEKMSTKRQREMLRQKRIAFDRAVEENRKNAVLTEEKSEAKNESTDKKKATTGKKKASQKAKK